MTANNITAVTPIITGSNSIAQTTNYSSTNLYDMSFGSSYNVSLSDFVKTSPASLTVKEGNLVIDKGDIIISGRSLLGILEKIEERLAILNPNTELEKDWQDLKDLKAQYQKLEEDFSSKQNVWNILKDADTPSK